MECNQHFCTCHDTKCNLNPHNHKEGCSPCIKKNLAAGEIPTCFFKVVSEDLTDVKDYSIQGFINFFNKH